MQAVRCSQPHSGRCLPQAAAEAAPKNSGFFGAFAGAFEAFLKVLDDGLEKLHVPYRWAGGNSMRAEHVSHVLCCGSATAAWRSSTFPGSTHRMLRAAQPSPCIPFPCLVSALFAAAAVAVPHHPAQKRWTG